MSKKPRRQYLVLSLEEVYKIVNESREIIRNSEGEYVVIYTEIVENQKSGQGYDQIKIIKVI